MRTFLRFQERYESPNPKFRSKPFTRAEFRVWYEKEHGSFSYYTDWSGCNLPSTILTPFFRGEFNPLTKAEKKLLSFFRDKRGLFYVIGTFGKGTLAMEHEICHALFFVDKRYRAAASRAVRAYWPKLKSLRKWLAASGYAEKVLVDECHAYVSADYDWLLKNGINVPKELHERLRKIRNLSSLK